MRIPENNTVNFLKIIMEPIIKGINWSKIISNEMVLIFPCQTGPIISNKKIYSKKIIILLKWFKKLKIHRFIY